MRCFVQNYMKDFDKFWFFDNDIGLKFMFKNLETNRLDRKYITEIFDEYENCSELDNYGLVGFTQNWHSLLTPSNSNEIISKGYVMQAFLVNNKVLKTKNISYTGDADVAEDFEIMLNCRLNNINFGVISKYVYTYVSTTNGNNWYSVDKMVKATYEKYKHTKLIKIATNKKGALKLHLLKEPELKINLWEM